ncbi:lytic transglycosylase domain-containing protein [Inquilinus sp. Marseille-Q2685]|uniref:lytic transglycosylase domain-containing protein n=1 Tax=Inquilinus sp. Marseille-Q2685 TaxID=2866581 RepID=UPI001CE435EC|nr:lytic transglycosylase domain-containing protein [Inquilinus sp. Marseille-Q2685]
MPAGRSPAPAIDRWRPLIAEASRRFGVPEHWVREVMRVESGGHATGNGRPIVSRAGAMGLMQVMPKTYEEMRRRPGLGADPQDPRDNILAGTAYLRDMWSCFGVPGAFAAYHAGPARLTEHLASGRPLPSETRRYLARLGVRLDRASAAPAAPAECALLKDRAAPGPAGLGPDRRRVLIGQGDGRELFVPLSTAAPAPGR